MRPKIVIPVLVLGLLTVALFILFRSHSGVATDSQSQETADAQPATDTSPGAPKPASRTPTNVQAGPKSPERVSPEGGPADGLADTAEEQYKTYVEKRVNELQDFSANGDKESLDAILSELSNRSPEIRKAAVEAAKQFGSRDAIPSLQDAANQTDDLSEKAEVNAAMEFLKLPSLTEVIKNGGQP